MRMSDWSSDVCSSDLVVLAQRRATRDRHRLLAAGRVVLGGDVDDAVGVDVEGDLDLRYAARGRREAGQFEVAKGLVLRPHLTLALGDLDLHRRDRKRVV